jgi:hypothetical protein
MTVSPTIARNNQSQLCGFLASLAWSLDLICSLGLIVVILLALQQLLLSFFRALFARMSAQTQGDLGRHTSKK